MNFRQVHLDFHTSEKIPGIGEKFDKKQFQNALIAGHVNSITIFAKCHHGWMYYPSKVGSIHPGLKFDLLKAQIEAAHEIGVKTPIYLSAGLDEQILHIHPEWRNQNKEHMFSNFAIPGYHLTCFNTPYLDLLLAQIKEVCENYDADGIFLDIVGVRQCCCDSCLKEMIKRGMNPNSDEDLTALGEEVYANYYKKVRETIDSVKPGLPVFHNGGHIVQGRRDLAHANTHLELESLPTGGWGYDHFPMSARYVQNLGMEYLGMTGKFHTSWGEFGGFKHPNALRYEVALSAAHGAKCSIGDQLSPDGHMDMSTYDLIGKAYAELEEKEPWLDNVSPVCDIAVLSNEAMNGERLPDAEVGAGRILIEGKYQFSVIDKEVPLDGYKLVILADNIILDDECEKRLKDFVNKGGKILASGKSAVSDGKFCFDFGSEYTGESEYKPSYIRPLIDNKNESDFIMYTACQKIKATDGKVLAEAVVPYFNRTAEHFCSHQHTPSSGRVDGAGIVSGKDGIYIAWNIFSDYAQKGEFIAKKTVMQCIDMLLGDEKVLVTNLGSMGVATLLEQKDRYIAHLLYAVPTKRGKNIEIIEDIYPVNDVELAVKVKENVKRVYLAPQNTDVDFTVDNGYVKVKGIKVDCHQMVVFDKE